MTDTTFTPGPWHAGADGRIVYSSDGWAICNAVTFHQRHQGEEDRANARLIAAAPEMARACDVAFQFLGSIDGAAEVRGVLLAALAKAGLPANGEG